MVQNVETIVVVFLLFIEKRSYNEVLIILNFVKGPPSALAGLPLHRENKENYPSKWSGKTHGIWTLCQNTGIYKRTQRTLCA